MSSKKILYPLLIISLVLILIDIYKIGDRTTVSYLVLILFIFHATFNFEMYNIPTLLKFSKILILIGFIGTVLFWLEVPNFVSLGRIWISLNNIVFGLYLYFYLNKMEKK